MGEKFKWQNRKTLNWEIFFFHALYNRAPFFSTVWAGANSSFIFSIYGKKNSQFIVLISPLKVHPIKIMICYHNLMKECHVFKIGQITMEQGKRKKKREEEELLEGAKHFISLSCCPTIHGYGKKLHIIKKKLSEK